MNMMTNPVTLDARQPDEAARSLVGDAGKPLWAMSRREIETALRAQAGLAPVRRGRFLLVLAAVVAVVVGAAGLVVMQRSDAANPDVPVASEPRTVPARQLVEAEYTVVEPTTLTRSLTLSGTLAPAQRAQLSAEVAGQIVEVAAKAGDPVTAGQPLVQIDTESLEIERDLALSTAAATRAQLALAEGQFARAEALAGRGITTDSMLDEARSGVEQLRATLAAQEDQVRAAELRLARSMVRAPFDGIVSERAVDPGQYVGTGASLMTVVDIARLELEGQLMVSSTLPRPGDEVEIAVDGLPGQLFTGVVERIGPVATEGSRTVPVYIGIDNPDGALLAGMFASGTVVLDRAPDAIGVPTEAVREDDAGSYVLRVEGGALVRVPVETTGTWSGSRVRIVAGLEPGDLILTAPLAGLDAGDAVTLAGM